MKKGILSLLFLPLLSTADESLPPSPAESFLSKAENMPSYEATFIKMLLTLGGLIILVLLTIYLLKKLSRGRFGSLGSQKKIIILEKKPLSPKTLLYLIELDGKKVLISESQLEVKTLVRFEDEQIYS